MKLKEVLVHLGKVIVAGAIFLIIADPPIVTVPVPAIPSLPLVINSSGNLKGFSLNAALKTDMEGQTPVLGIGYTKPPTYMVPGTLSWDGKLNGSQESIKLEKDGSFVIVDDTASGAVEWTVVLPAQDPTTPPGCVPPACNPDTGGPYPGTWTLLNAGQTKLVTVE